MAGREEQVHNFGAKFREIVGWHTSRFGMGNPCSKVRVTPTRDGSSVG